MNQRAEPEALDDSLRVLRRITHRELLTEDGQTRITSQAFIQGTPDGDVSVAQGQVDCRHSGEAPANRSRRESLPTPIHRATAIFVAAV